MLETVATGNLGIQFFFVEFLKVKFQAPVL